jgi:DedD protein
MLGVDLTTVGSPSPSPSPSVSSSPSPEPEGGNWKVQLGVFAQRRNAEDLVAKLRESGHIATIVNSEDNGNQSFKVQMGPYANKQEALTTVDSLKSQGFQQAFLVEEND